MNQTEFMDLLRYYFRRISEAELQDILSDYESHFKEGKARGLTEEEICRELGSPKAVYEMYLHEGMIHEKEGVPLPDAPAPPERSPARQAASQEAPSIRHRTRGPAPAAENSPARSAPLPASS